MNKIVQSFLLFLIFISNFELRAYDFKVGALCYNIINLDSLYVEVTADDDKYVGSIIIPPTVHYANREFTVTKIGNQAFYQCSGLTKVEIPNTVKSIGEFVYDNGYSWYNSSVFAQSGITEITIPNSVVEIGSNSFYRCYNLKKLIIEDGNSTLSLGYGYITTWQNEIYGLFADTKLEEVYIGRDLFYQYKYYGNQYTISPFKASTRTDISSRPTIQIATFGNQITTIPIGLFSGCNTLENIILGQNTTKIDNSAFANTAVESIVLPNSLDSICPNAFYGCGNLKSINIIDNIKYVGDAAFSNCVALSSITIGNGCTMISPSCFRGCVSLLSVNIPDNVTTIGPSAFSECASLSSIVLSTSIDSIGPSCFSRTGIKSIVLPNSLKSISSQCFYDCKSLETIAFPDGLLSIGASAFEGCTSMNAIKLPESVRGLSSKAFFEDNSLMSITVKNSNPITITDDVFGNMSYLMGTLYVPIGYLNDYETADVWNKFYSIVEGEGNGDQPMIPDVSLTIRCSEGGSVIFNTFEVSNETITTNVETNSPLVFIIRSSEDYKLSKVIFNDVDVTSSLMNDTLRVEGVINNSAITVIFEELPKCLTIKQSNQCDLILLVNKGESCRIRIPSTYSSYLQSITFNNIDVTSQLTEDFTYETPKIYDNVVLSIQYTDNSILTGDLDGDGRITISDVTDLIDILLGGN